MGRNAGIVSFFAYAALLFPPQAYAQKQYGPGVSDVAIKAGRPQASAPFRRRNRPISICSIRRVASTAEK
jgi:hypothetical protein